MDRSLHPYAAGLDACDPLGSFLSSGGCQGRAARVLRRRCRSEGLERTPYEDASYDWHTERIKPHRQPSKSQFTIHNGHLDRYVHECSLPAAENGDFHMAYPGKNYYQPTKSPLRSPPQIPSPTKSREKHLPRVEELFEKMDHDIMELSFPKQPLKSILNNPPPVHPQGILKKPNVKPRDSRVMDGRRRPRAASESDNLYGNFHLSSPVPPYDSRLTFLSTNATKRAKDNLGTGYSYGSAFAMTTTPTSSRRQKSPKQPAQKEPEKPRQPVKPEPHVLRTTAIHNKNSNLDIITEVQLPRFDRSPPPPAPTTNTSTTRAISPKKVKKKGRKSPKPASQSTIKAGSDSPDQPNGVDLSSRSPSAELDLSWQMETDTLLAEIDKLEKSLPSRPPASPIAHTVIHQVNGDSKKEDVKEKTKAELIKKREESPLSIPDLLTNVLRPSLFPRVPPYIRFVGHDAHSIKIPNAIGKHLKWKLTNITPIIVKKTLLNSGFKLVKSECDTSECPQEETVEWIGIWGKHMKSLLFRAIREGQKMNHFPGTFQIGRKDRLWRNLQKLSKRFGDDEFGIMPKTYVLPHDLKILKSEWDKHAENNEKWIIKPPASARGTGIKVVTRWTQIPKKRPVVVQRYIAKPYLINGSKFDLRLYVLVTSIHPLRIYMFKDGLARFASVKYNDDIMCLNDRYMHLTNYSINRLSKNYTPNEDYEACEGHKWTLKALFQYLQTERNINVDELWESLKDVVIKTIISGEPSISALSKTNITSRYNCYELFGVDVLLDEDLKPWLLEANISPSLHSASPLDIHVKGPLVSAVLNIAQFQVPAKTQIENLSVDRPQKLLGLPYDNRLYTVYLSKEERDKHIIYTNMDDRDRDVYLRDILSTLTPDDVRHLIQAEDELTQAWGCERIFPSAQTHKYLKYCSARYYNRLFDAWEVRYGNDRRTGIELLRNLCDIGYHLEVPPVPLKNDVDAPTPPMSKPTSIVSLELDDAKGFDDESAPTPPEAEPVKP